MKFALPSASGKVSLEKHFTEIISVKAISRLTFHVDFVTGWCSLGTLGTARHTGITKIKLKVND